MAAFVDSRQTSRARDESRPSSKHGLKRRRDDDTFYDRRGSPISSSLGRDLVERDSDVLLIGPSRRLSRRELARLPQDDDRRRMIDGKCRRSRDSTSRGKSPVRQVEATREYRMSPRCSEERDVRERSGGAHHQERSRGYANRTRSSFFDEGVRDDRHSRTSRTSPVPRSRCSCGLKSCRTCTYFPSEHERESVSRHEFNVDGHADYKGTRTLMCGYDQDVMDSDLGVPPSRSPRATDVRSARWRHSEVSTFSREERVRISPSPPWAHRQEDFRLIPRTPQHPGVKNRRSRSPDRLTSPPRSSRPLRDHPRDDPREDRGSTQHRKSPSRSGTNRDDSCCATAPLAGQSSTTLQETFRAVAAADSPPTLRPAAVMGNEPCGKVAAPADAPTMGDAVVRARCMSFLATVAEHHLPPLAAAAGEQTVSFFHRGGGSGGPLLVHPGTNLDGRPTGVFGQCSPEDGPPIIALHTPRHLVSHRSSVHEAFPLAYRNEEPAAPGTSPPRPQQPQGLAHGHESPLLLRGRATVDPAKVDSVAALPTLLSCSSSLAGKLGLPGLEGRMAETPHFLFNKSMPAVLSEGQEASGMGGGICGSISTREWVSADETSVVANASGSPLRIVRRVSFSSRQVDMTCQLGASPRTASCQLSNAGSAKDAVNHMALHGMHVRQGQQDGGMVALGLEGACGGHPPGCQEVGRPLIQAVMPAAGAMGPASHAMQVGATPPVWSMVPPTASTAACASPNAQTMERRAMAGQATAATTHVGTTAATAAAAEVAGAAGSRVGMTGPAAAAAAAAAAALERPALLLTPPAQPPVLRASRAQLDLNRQLTRCRTAEAVLSQLHGAWDGRVTLNGVNITTALSLLARHVSGGAGASNVGNPRARQLAAELRRDPRFLTLMELAGHDIGMHPASFGARELANLSYAPAKILGALTSSEEGGVRGVGMEGGSMEYNEVGAPRRDQVGAMEVWDTRQGAADASSAATCDVLMRRLYVGLEREVLARADRVGEYTEQGLSMLVWGFATLRISAPALFALVECEITRRGAPCLGPQNMAMTLWAYGSARVPSPRLLTSVTQHLRATGMAAFQPQEMAMLAWSYARLGGGADGGPLPQVEAESLARGLAEFNGQDLANIVWAFATAGTTAPALFNAVAREVEQRFRFTGSLLFFQPQHLSMLVWSFAKAGCAAPPVFRAVETEMTGRGFASFDPQGLSMAVWAFASGTPDKGASSKQLFELIAVEVCSKMSSGSTFLPQELAMLAWSFATGGHSAPGLFAAVARDVCRRRWGPFEEQDMAMILWAYATAGVMAPELFESAKGELSVGSDRMAAFTPMGLSMVAWAYATMGQDAGGRVMDAVAAEVVTRGAPAFKPLDLANIAWASARLSHARARAKQVMDAIEEEFVAIGAETLPIVTTLGNGPLASLLWAYAALGIRARRLFQAAERSLLSRPLEGFRSDELADLVWAYTSLNFPAWRLFLAVAAVFMGERRSEGLSGHHLAMLLWCYATLGCLSDSLVKVLAERLVPATLSTGSNDHRPLDAAYRPHHSSMIDMAGLSERDLAMLAFAFGSLRGASSPGASGLVLSLVEAECLRRGLGAFTLSEMGMVAWGCADAGYNASWLLSAVQAHLLPRLGDRSLPVVFYDIRGEDGMRGSGMAVGGCVIASWCRHEPHTCQGCVRDLVDVMWSCVALGSISAEFADMTVQCLDEGLTGGGQIGPADGTGVLQRGSHRGQGLGELERTCRLAFQAICSVYPRNSWHVGPQGRVLARLQQMLGAQSPRAGNIQPGAHQVLSLEFGQVCGELEGMLTALHVPYETHVPALFGAYVLDIVVRGPLVERWGGKLCVEVDGPSHYLPDGEIDPATRLKHRVLEKDGWCVRRVPYNEWQQRGSELERRRYLQGLLDLPMG